MSALYVMKEYYIHQGGQQTGPYSLEDLSNKGLTPTTMVWYTGTGHWMPASEIDELAELIGKKPPPLVGSDNVHLSGKYKAGQAGGRNYSTRWLIVVGACFVLALAIGLVVLIKTRRDQAARQTRKEWVKSIHEREVKKTIKEQQAVKIAQKQTEEQRRDSLQRNRSALQVLNGKLNGVLAERRTAIEELEDIRRPRLFRSRKKMERQAGEQQAYIDALDIKADNLRSKIAACKQDIDRLSASLKQ
jgi:hypothetical protein